MNFIDINGNYKNNKTNGLEVWFFGCVKVFRTMLKIIALCNIFTW